MSGLVDYLRARLDEEEDAAKRAAMACRRQLLRARVDGKVPPSGAPGRKANAKIRPTLPFEDAQAAPPPAPDPYPAIARLKYMAGFSGANVSIDFENASDAFFEDCVLLARLQLADDHRPLSLVEMAARSALCFVLDTRVVAKLNYATLPTEVSQAIWTLAKAYIRIALEVKKS